MAVCPSSTYTSTGGCGGEVLKTNGEQWWCYYEDFRAEVEADTPTIVIADNEITTFEPIDLLRRCDPNTEFSIAPTSTSAITEGGSNKFTHSIICQLKGSSADADLQKALLAKGDIVFFIGIDGSSTPADKYKVYGVERGLSLAAGGFVENLDAQDGTAIATFTSVPERAQFENYTRHTLKTSTTAAAEKAALDAAVVTP